MEEGEEKQRGRKEGKRERGGRKRMGRVGRKEERGEKGRKRCTVICK